MSPQESLAEAGNREEMKTKLNVDRRFYEKQNEFQLKAEKRREVKEQRLMEQREEQHRKIFEEQQRILKYEELFDSKGW